MGVMIGITLVRKRVALLGAAVMLVVLAAGCGSDDEPTASSSEPTDAVTSVEAWVDDVCTTVSTWSGEVGAAAAALDDPKNVSVNSFNDAVTAVADATRTMAHEVGELSPPDIEGGDAAQEEFSNLSDSVASEVDVISSVVDGDADTAEDMVAAASTISGSISAIGADIEATLDSIVALDAAGEVQDAVASTESCQHVGTAG